MVRPPMLVDFPGLTKEELPSGQIRWRVRPRGDHRKRITLSVGPSDEDFNRQYQLARAGHQPEPMKKASEVAKPKSISWLVAKYFEYLEERIKAGTFSAKTLKKKRNLFRRLLKHPDKEAMIPQERLIEMQDEMAATPAQADAFIEAVGVMYQWAIPRKYVRSNPAHGIAKIYEKGDGATPWKGTDVDKFFATHRPGSKAHVCMSVLLWTGCRIEDTTMLGRRFECVIDGKPHEDYAGYDGEENIGRIFYENAGPTKGLWRWAAGRPQGFKGHPIMPNAGYLFTSRDAARQVEEYWDAMKILLVARNLETKKDPDAG